MSVVGAVALLTGLACFYFGARALNFRRAVARVNRRDATEKVTGADDAPTAWLTPPGESPEMPDDPASEIAVERGVALLVLGLLCLLFGLFSF
ncbi:hypothetical protein [Halogeometricum limi]|uniref:Uncharacterized protein n=1 Tax=Halogeometricum limi TaxID=555875 RepID=A0A1I6FQR8_9EURY|nr:hypothetical protein [Halogeometricum limi]SFR32127.1 hypothetical protein SAMN04488124_0066 [Halogeometricum limi]